MIPVINVLKSFYRFLVGDIVILISVCFAFVLLFILTRFNVPSLITGFLFIMSIVIGLVASLSHEIS